METTTDQFMKLKEVQQIVNLSRSAIYAQMARGTFPLPRKISGKSVRWVRSEIAAWMQNLPVSDLGPRE